jgi:Uma2 family endonuclease
MVALTLFETSFESRSLTLDPPLTDEELEALCLRSDTVQIERTWDGVILMHAPTGGFTGSGNLEILRQLGNWWDTHKRGRVFDSNTGFFLPDGSLLSPDAAYVLPEQLRGLTKADLARMPRLCPEFVMELLSQSDSLAGTRKKMACWIANGAQLGWLVDPYRQCVEVYAPDSDAVTISETQVIGSGPVEGFVLDAAGVWSCFEI